MKSAKAFAPGNISCIFVIKKTKNPAKSGSLGMGFTVNKGVIVAIKKIHSSNIKKTNNKIFYKNYKKINENIKNIIYFNNKKINFSTVSSVIEKLTNEKVKVNIESELPLGCGFGLSGASALATAYALNKLLRLKRSKKELAFIAHVAEVENRTGLGDIVNQYYGGFLIKYEPSYRFKVKNLPIKNKKIYYQYFSPIKTKNIIINKKIKNKINNSGLNSLNKIKKLGNKNLRSLITISKEFSIKSGLLKNKKIINIIKKIESRNGNASMIMLGNAVFSDKYFKSSRELIIKDKGACLC
jgi:pantoate kinase|tara:strand:- start:2489 stop:3382 length:894 start_codon:yes stop_codon:yes gene_type:complete